MISEYRRLPNWARFALANLLIGTVLGWLCAAVVLVFDINGIGSLVMGAPYWGLALPAMVFFFGKTFGVGYLTTAILMLPTPESEFDPA